MVLLTILANCVVLGLEIHLPNGDKTPLAIKLVSTGSTACWPDVSLNDWLNDWLAVWFLADWIAVISNSYRSLTRHSSSSRSSSYKGCHHNHVMSIKRHPGDSLLLCAVMCSCDQRRAQLRVYIIIILVIS